MINFDKVESVCMAFVWLVQFFRVDGKSWNKNKDKKKGIGPAGIT